eukprot:CAMPEP_0168614502 /NCGR_PEP_ID=MMETSP0449_2-20121227/4008_1 /TAXON_ID=1082188 /ORGANISM="Strombidium rassoulzadegani, Strain ras09" /LENGTH=539 /DNA_ID=CAMNT_0008655185 /DNA_START=191 /DNA_END=1807 /DNA_ORIENTATION=-
MQESGVGHGAQLDELHRLQVQHHRVLRARTVVVPSQDNHLVRRDEGGGLGLDRQREFDGQHAPLVIRHIVLLDRVYPAAALVTAEDVDVGVLEDDSRHGAPLLVEIGNSLPPVHVDRVALAALEHPVDGSAPDRVHEVALVREGVSVPALVETRLLGADLVVGVVHVDGAGDVGEAGVEATRDEDVSVRQPNSHRVGLEGEVVGHLLTRPQVLGEVVIEDEVLVVGVAEEVALGDGLELVVEELEGVLVGELDHGVLELPDLLEHLVGDLGVQAHRAVLELVEGRVEGLVDVEELLLHALDLALVLDLALLQALDLLLDLDEVDLAPLHVLLGLHQEDLLLLVVLLHGLREGVLAVLEHLDHQLQLLVELGERVLLLLLQLLLNLADVVLEDLSLGDGRLDLLLQRILLLHEGVHFLVRLEQVVADLVALVVARHALRADVDLVILAEVLGLLLGVLEAELVDKAFLVLLVPLVLLLHQAWCSHAVQTRTDSSELIQLLLVVNVVQDGEVLDELLDLGREELAAGGAGEDVGGSQVHEA